jgi:hypothetical protein
MRLIPIFIILGCLFIFSLTAVDNPIDKVKWSTYQGKKTYQEAKDHCQNMKMRLPTIDELKQAQEAGNTKSWIKNGSRYWAVNKDLTKKNSIYYNALSLQDMEYEWKVEIHRLESQLGVFCANVTEESLGYDLIRELIENNASESEIQKAREGIGFTLGSKMYSEYQGAMTWNEANKKCKSLKMQLPTLSELNKAYELGITKSWQKDGYYYWSSTPYDAERYYVLVVYGGRTGDSDRNYTRDVRCRR